MAERAVEEDQQAQKRFKPEFLDTTKIIVGEGEKTQNFIVHTSHMCDKSPFFVAACSKKWQENPEQEKVVKLPEVEPHIFKIYTNWVYTGQIDIDTADYPKFAAFQRKGHNIAYLWVDQCCSVYMLADMLLDSKAKHLIIDMLRGFECKQLRYMATNTIRDVWEYTPRGCGLQRLFLDQFACVKSSHTMAMAVESQFSPSFLFDLASR